MYKDTTVYVLGHGKTSSDNAITSTFKIFFIGFGSRTGKLMRSWVNANRFEDVLKNACSIAPWERCICRIWMDAMLFHGVICTISASCGIESSRWMAGRWYHRQSLLWNSLILNASEQPIVKHALSRREHPSFAQHSSVF